MKRFTILIPLMTMCCLMVGCSTSEIAEPITQTSMATYTNAAPQFSKAMLSFESEAAMKEAVNELLDMTESERNVWYIGQNADFISQEDAMWAVVAELNTKKSMEEIRSCQDKYSSIFIFNRSEFDKDVSPYLPHNTTGISLVCNAYGDVSIGGKQVNMNDITEYWQTDYAKCLTLSRAVSPVKDNYLFADTYDRKFWAEAKWAGPGHDVYIHYVAHENIWDLGIWNKYKTSYHVRFDYIVAEGGIRKYDPFYEQVKDSKMDGLWTGELESYIDHPCFTPEPGKDMSVGFRIYSRGVGAANEGTLKIFFEI